MPSNTIRIAKNTLMLYFRQILIMLVSLYTVRVVLNTLGAEDYGIYNVAAGIVTMFGFLSSAMSSASQRYFAFEIGRDNFEQLKKVFSISLLIYVLIAVLIVIIAETAGLWFVSNKLAVPLERKEAALWVYQFSIISFLFTILTSPYMAVIIAHEDMNIYAYVSIIEAGLKLGIVFVLRIITFDSLIVYGILTCIVTFINTAIYRIICKRKYKECVFGFFWNKELFKELTSYTGWNLFGTLVRIFNNQGINILLNQFFNSEIVAARSIASSVNGTASNFSNNFNNALRPQIVKNYAMKQNQDVINLMFNGIKGTYCLMYVFALPLMLEMPLVLNLWLKNPPEYTVLFTRLILINVVIEVISYPINGTAQATGKIRLYQFVVNGILLLNLPISWIVLLTTAEPRFVLMVSIYISLIASVLRLYVLKRLISFSILNFIRKVIIPIFCISILTAVPPLLAYHFFVSGLPRLFIVVLTTVVSIGITFYLIGLNDSDKEKIKIIVLNKLQAHH
jgi:O-antigen/teichoic acid export membrane protein